jgi:hypothetical protein
MFNTNSKYVIMGVHIPHTRLYRFSSCYSSTALVNIEIRVECEKENRNENQSV